MSGIEREREREREKERERERRGGVSREWREHNNLYCVK
jgi:hypothetical protein